MFDILYDYKSGSSSTVVYNIFYIVSLSIGSKPNVYMKHLIQKRKNLLRNETNDFL